MELIKIQEAIVTEGKYDKIKLSSIIDGLVVCTNGFRIFRDTSNLNLIRELAVNKGIVILTDSDSAGFMIRNYIKGSVTKGTVKHAYIPSVKGKEKRKNIWSKERCLGVEGIDQNVIINAIRESGAILGDISFLGQNSEKIKKIDLYEFGLLGKQNSAQKRKLFKKYLNIPDHTSVNSFLQILNYRFSLKELSHILEEYKNE